MFTSRSIKTRKFPLGESSAPSISPNPAPLKSPQILPNNYPPRGRFIPTLEQRIFENTPIFKRVTNPALVVCLPSLPKSPESLTRCSTRLPPWSFLSPTPSRESPKTPQHPNFHTCDESSAPVVNLPSLFESPESPTRCSTSFPP